MNKQKLTTQIEIQALVGQAEQALKSFKQSFESTWSSGQPPKSLSKSWEGLRLQLASLKEIAGKEFVNSSDLAQANSDYKSIQKTIHNLKVEFATFSEEQKRALIAPEEQKAMKARTAAVEEYTKALKKSEEVAKQRKTLTQQKNTAETNITQQKALKAGKEERIVKLRASAPSKSDTKAWIEYTQKIKQLQEEVRNCSQEIRSSESEIDSINKTLSKLKTPEEEFDSLKETLKSLGVEGVDKAKNIDQVSKILKKMDKEALAKVSASLKETEGQLDDFGKEAASIKGEIDKGTEAIEAQNKALQSQEAFEARIKQFLGLAGATEILRRSLRNAFETTKELDAAMTEMAVVTDLEVGDYWEQLPEHTKRASELGVAIKDVYEAETLYYQQGLKTAEAQALANETLKMARIAGLDASDATNKMTAALRGFNMELNEASAQKVSDVYSELAAITAADVNEISSAMTKTASIASSAGMEFETTAAFLSQIIETTRESAETAGTAMKTVIARFQELKKSPDEIGEIDGEIVDANAIETALRSVGVSLRDTSGQFRELDDVFLELSSKWDSLDKNTQRYIATIAAGSRQQSRFIAMMSDYGRTQELVTAANNSAGASQKQYEKTLESLETKLAKLKNAWDEFSMGILQSDLVKFGVDALTKFLEIINKATSAFDGMGGTIMKVLTTIAMFKIGQKIFEKIKSPITKFGEELKINFFNFGKESGKSFVEGTKQGVAETQAEGVPKTSEAEQKKKAEEEAKKEETLKQKALNKTGIGNINTGRKKIKSISAEREENSKKIEQLKAEQQSKKEEGWYKDGEGSEKRTKGAAAARKEYEALGKEIDELEAKEKNFAKESEAAWKQVEQGVSQLGQTVAGVGVGISMFGSVLSSLGLEEVGETISWIGTLITMAGSALMAIPPILTVITAHPIIALITAIAAAVIGLIAAIVKFVKNNSLEARMEKAAEATKKAQETAEKASKAYDEMLSSRDGYNELQKQIENLTKGTEEWRRALRESNQEVLKLLETYPELSKYIARGSDGQLVITDEGWDAILNLQKQAVKNSQNTVMQKQFNELELKIESLAPKNYKTATTVYTYTREKKDGTEEEVIGTHATNHENEVMSAELRRKIEDLYVSGLDSETIKTELNKINNEYNITADQLKEINEEFSKNADELKVIREESEAIARANLTATASNRILDSDYGSAVIDAFSNSVNGSQAARLEEEKKEKLGGNIDTSGDDYQNNDEFKKIAKAYGVEDRLLGKDKKDLKTLYAAVQGISVQDIDENITDKEMWSAIANSEVTKDREELMDKYLTSLETLGRKDKLAASNVAGLFSKDGMGMSAQFAKDLVGSDGTGELNKAKIEEIAKSFDMTVDDLAKSVGKTTEELYQEITENARKNVIIIKDTYSKLNIALGRNGENLIEQFGTEVALSAQNQKALAEKLVHASQTIGEEGANRLKDSLDAALDSAEDKAGAFAGVLGSMNWSSVEDWEKLPEILDGMGIDTTTKAFKDFIEQVKECGIQIKVINLNTITEQIQNMYNALKSMLSGEQGRTFSKDTYDKLIASNPKLANDFMQVGDSFYYLGNSMEELQKTIKQQMVYDGLLAAEQLKINKGVSDALIAFEGSNDIKTTDGINLKLDGDYSNWSKDQMVTYLNAFRAQAESLGVKSLQFIADEQGKSLGMSLGADFNLETEEQLREYMKALDKLKAENTKLGEEATKMFRDSIALQYTFESAASLIAMAAQKDASYDEDERKEADIYRQALAFKAQESGYIADAVIDSYQTLINKDEKDLTSADKTELTRLENVIQKGVDRSVKTLEKLSSVNNYTNQAMAALETIAQKEIDELTEINDSINTANEKLLSKVQEQINADRQDRQNKKTEESIANKQSQLSYLMSDTSGANAMQILELQKQIEEEQQQYEDDLVDQRLQEISDANAEAAEQRERQIAILEETLEYNKENGFFSREAERIVTTSLRQISQGVDPLETELYDLLFKAEDMEGKMATELQQQEFNGQFQKATTEAANDLADIEGNQDEAKGIQDDQLTAEENIENTAKDIHAYLYGGENSEGETVTGLTEKEAAAAQTAIDNVTTRNEALQAGLGYAKSAGGIAAISNGGAGANDPRAKAYAEAKERYVAADGNEAEFDELVQKLGGTELDSYRFQSLSAPRSNFNMPKAVNDKKDEPFKVSINSKNYDVQTVKDSLYTGLAESMKNAGVASNSVVKYQGELYYYTLEGYGDKLSGAPRAFKLKNAKDYSDILSMTNWTKYKTGGLADFTGPAWLDGTKSQPELVLNARDTENFIMLKDILSEILSDTGSLGNKQSKNNGDNYFEININVEEISDDYDVEQLADKIRNMLYDDAAYRNVNAISHIR